MGWRLAASLKKLRSEIDDAFDGRDTDRDGSIGDQRHSARKSDHNPNDEGYVTAIDVDENHDEAVGKYLWSFLRQSKDPRIKYVIYEGKMFSSYPARGHGPWEVREYHGANMHTGHLHISVVGDKRLYNSKKAWGVAPSGADVPKPSRGSKGFDVASLGTLKNGSRGEGVRVLQHLLGLYASSTKVDGIFGNDTERQLRNCQTKLGVNGDGICGPITWGALLRAD